MHELAPYVDRIRSLDWAELADLWASIRSGAARDWAPGKAFEHLVLRAFELDGATVRWPFVVTIAGARAEQIDGAVHAAGLSCIVESKDSALPVDFVVLAKMRSQLARRPAGTIGVVVSRSGFTLSAVTLAGFLSPQTVLMISGEELEVAMANRRTVALLTAKYRECVEEGMSPRKPARSVAL
jgi:hypothetical protein